MYKIYFYLIMLATLVACNEIEQNNEDNGENIPTLDRTLSNKQKQELTENLASVLHESWRSNRRTPDGSFEPRLKKTVDTIWIKANQTDEVDIANTSFLNLPFDWQKENLAAAKVAMQEVVTAHEQGIELDSAFVEEASEQVHIEWLERNREWAPENQKLPYTQLSEEEKAKDRLQVLKAIEVFQQKF